MKKWGTKSDLGGAIKKRSNNSLFIFLINYFWFFDKYIK